MSGRKEYLETYKGQKNEYWKRVINNSIIITYELEKFQTKKSKSPEENIKFQKFILDLLIKKKRRCFRKDVAIEFSFSINQKNPPAIQSLLKHYIDLIQKTNVKLETKRKYLLIKDDSQIKALNAYYRKSNKANKQNITIIIKPIRDFIKDLEFARDMELGKFPKEKNNYLDKNDFDTSIEALNKISQKYDNLNSLKKIFKNEYFNLHKQLLDEERHQYLLKINSRLSANSLLILITKPDIIKKNVKSKIYFPINRIARSSTLSGWYSIDFGDVPTSNGDSKLFKKKVIEKINEWKKKNGKQLPKRSFISLKFFYEKPENVNHDLDNLIKYVLPHFNDLINQDRVFKDIISIEIYQIQTIQNNKASGNLFLKIEDINNNMFHITRKLMEDYE